MVFGATETLQLRNNLSSIFVNLHKAAAGSITGTTFIVAWSSRRDSRLQTVHKVRHCFAPQRPYINQAVHAPWYYRSDPTLAQYQFKSNLLHNMSDNKTFSLGDFKLKSGKTIPNAFIAYKTFGSPSNPAIIYPTWYSGTIWTNEWLIGDSMALSPKEYFIIVPALIGNGESISPSNTPDLRPWPNVTFYDNVAAQYRLVTEELGVKHAKAVLGWSMGAGQTFQWITQYPDFMDLAVPFLGAAKTSLHNQVFLEGVKAATLGGKGSMSGGIVKGESTPDALYRGWSDEERKIGMKALGRVYAGWGFSQAFYREKLYETQLGFKNLEDFMLNFWEAWALSKDPENMMAMLWTWQAGDCSDQEPYKGGKWTI